MKITDQEVRYVADLANLTLSGDEVPRMVRDLDEILTYMEKLNELDTSSVEPMAQVLSESGESATLREDEPRRSLSNEEALANAAKSASGYYKVPLVIER